MYICDCIIYLVCSTLFLTLVSPQSFMRSEAKQLQETNIPMSDKNVKVENEMTNFWKTDLKKKLKMKWQISIKKKNTQQAIF